MVCKTYSTRYTTHNNTNYELLYYQSMYVCMLYSSLVSVRDLKQYNGIGEPKRSTQLELILLAYCNNL